MRADAALALGGALLCLAVIVVTCWVWLHGAAVEVPH